MSRTYRRLDRAGKAEIKRWMSRPWWQEDSETERYRFVAHYHSDGYNPHGCKVGLRRATTESRRAKQRVQLNKVYKCEDFCDSDYDPSYEESTARRLIWVYF